MKLRIQGNSIRLRLTQTEVQRIAEGETVQERVPFGSSATSLTYALTSEANLPQVAAHYHAHAIQITLPADVAHAWATTEQVSIEETVPPDGLKALHVLVEKDYQCLHRPSEEEPDNFPNPAAVAD